MKTSKTICFKDYRAYIFKGLLTKSGYITKIKKITGHCAQTTAIACVTLQIWKKVECNQDISNSNWNYDFRSRNQWKPM